MTTTETISVTQLTKATPELLKQINALLPQLSTTARPLTMAGLADIVRSDASHLYIATDAANNHMIVGAIILGLVRQLVGTKYWIEDVVVSREYRGLGIGERLMRTVLDDVPSTAHSINLTSKPARVTAHGMYHKLGFEIRDTVVYRLTR